MYNLMVVDDDFLVRKRIVSAIPFDQLGLKLCAEAETGIDALDMYEHYHPQIIIMDINIPLINGIDVSKKILQNNEEVYIVIITGYGTVDFAKEAIRSGMIDFLLKPINAEELKMVLERIVGRIRDKAQKALEQQRMERLLERSMPLLRNKYFLSLMTTPTAEMSEKDCRVYLKDFGIIGDVTDITVVIVSPRYNGATVNEKMTIQGILEQELLRGIGNTNEQFRCVVLFDSLQRAILVVYGTQKNLGYCLEKNLSAIRDRIRYIHHIDFRASIGCGVTEFRQLEKSYRTAEDALGYWSVFGDNDIVSSENVQHIVGRASKETVTIHHSEVMSLFVAKNLDDITRKLNEYMNSLIQENSFSEEYLRQRIIELTALMISCARELGVDCSIILAQKPYMKVLNATNMSEIRRIVLKIGESIVEEIGSTREQNKNKTINNAKHYIMQNYADPELNLSKVAENVNLSPSYLSQLFRKQSHCSFTDYLNYVRIEQAKRLLADTHMRVYEVADAVGYQSSKYFFQVFKQITGKRPREFGENTGTSADG